MDLKYRKAVEDMSAKIIEALKCAKHGDYPSAIAIVDEILESETSPDLRRDAFGFRAIFFEDLGRFEEAKADLLDSYSLVPTEPVGAATFAKSTTEFVIGRVCEKQSEANEAFKWYKKALETIRDGNHCDGGTALIIFINFVGERNLSYEDRVLCNEVALKSWEIMRTMGRVEGEPDLANLLETAEEIIKAGAKPGPAH